MLCKFPHWNVAAMLTGLAFVVGLEFLGVFTHRHLTLSYLIRSYIPRPLIVVLLGILTIHLLKK